MSVTIEQRQEQLIRLREQEHSRCVVCGTSHPTGLRLEFAVRQDGSVEGSFLCTPNLQGYANTLHGGVVASLVDGAMTNCLFAHGIVAVTGELTVRILCPISTGSTVKIEASLERSLSPVYHLAAKLFQGETMVAKASGTFVESQFAQKLGRYQKGSCGDGNIESPSQTHIHSQS